MTEHMLSRKHRKMKSQHGVCLQYANAWAWPRNKQTKKSKVIFIMLLDKKKEKELKKKKLTLFLTCLRVSLSSCCCLAALTALSICDWRPALSSMVTATWFSKVATRRIILCWSHKTEKTQQNKTVLQHVWRVCRWSKVSDKIPLTARERERSQICRGSSGLWKASCGRGRTHLGSL